MLNCNILFNQTFNLKTLFVSILTHTTPFITYINVLLFSILLNDKKDVSLFMSFGHDNANTHKNITHHQPYYY